MDDYARLEKTLEEVKAWSFLVVEGQRHAKAMKIKKCFKSNEYAENTKRGEKKMYANEICSVS